MQLVRYFHIGGFNVDTREELTLMLRDYPDLMNVKNIQNILHIGRSNAYGLLKCGKIKHIRIGSKYLIPKPYLVDFLSKPLDCAGVV
jgi:hypothetical protein